MKGEKGNLLCREKEGRAGWKIFYFSHAMYNFMTSYYPSLCLAPAFRANKLATSYCAIDSERKTIKICFVMPFSVVYASARYRGSKVQYDVLKR